MSLAPTFKTFGPHAVLINWPSEISEDIHEQIVFWQELLKKQFTQQIIDLVPSYAEIAVYLDNDILAEEFIRTLLKLKVVPSERQQKSSRLIKIPVCYDELHAPDLKALAQANGLTPAEVVELHTTPIYTVYFIGFLPGFPYLGGLDSRLFSPRRGTPRHKVPVGAVGIGGEQTGIYPSSSPGGWQLIGRSPIALFDPYKEPPTILRAGDRIQLVSISNSDFNTVALQVEQGVYRLNIETYD